MATRKLNVNLDLGLNQLLNFLLQSLSTAPAAGVGRLYYDTNLKQIGFSDGSGWYYASTLTSDGVKALVGGMLVGTQVVPTYDSTAKTVTFTIGNAVITNSMVAGNAAISADKLADGSNYVIMTTAERTKLAGVATGATNYTNAMALANALNTFAVPTAALAMNSQRITGMADPVNPQDAATKSYVDATATGLDVKGSVRLATTANITLSGTQTIDGVNVVAGDRVLVKNQTTATQNGIYVVASGSWTRAGDADNSPSGEVSTGLFTFVEDGTLNQATGWLLTTKGAITLGTTTLTFVQFSGAGTYTAGNGLTASGSTFSVLPVAGGGISVSAAGVTLDTTVAARRASGTIGDGAATTFTVTHNLGTRSVVVSIMDTSTYEDVDAYVVKTNTNTISITFNAAPTSGQFLVTVLG
jgi:hypothetical protein